MAKGLRIAIRAGGEKIRARTFNRPPARRDVEEALAALFYGPLPEGAHLSAYNLYTGEILAFVDDLDGTEEDGEALDAFVGAVLRAVVKNRDPDLFPRDGGRGWRPPRVQSVRDVERTREEAEDAFLADLRKDHDLVKETDGDS